MAATAESAARMRAAYSAQARARMARFLEINGPYLPVREATRRMGVCERTISRWRHALGPGRRSGES
jgi:transposase-like protein